MCMHGSKRDKWTCLRTNMSTVSRMQAVCDGKHKHAPWGYNSNTKGYNTAEEAEYPPLFCRRLAECVYEQLSSQWTAVIEDEYVRHEQCASCFQVPDGLGPSRDMITRRKTQYHDAYYDSWVTLEDVFVDDLKACLLYTSPSPRDS